MRAVIYLRRSTDRQEASLSDQRSELKTFAGTLGHDIIGEYVDDAISGDTTEKRIGFQAMIRDAGKKAFQVILAWDLDRFGRFDAIEAGYWVKPLRDAGVALQTIAQGKVDWNDFAGRLLWSVQTEAKHQYLRDLARNCVRGVRSAVAGGVWLGPAPFGYRKAEKRLILGPAAEIAAVKRVFELRLKGFGHRAIGLMMRADSHPHPHGQRTLNCLFSGVFAIF